jgi:hypothetical protein
MRGLQAGPQHVAVLGEEVVLTVNQQTHHLALRDVDAEREQLRHRSLHRHLALVVLQQNTKRRSSGPQWLLTPAGNAATMVCPSGTTKSSYPLNRDPTGAAARQSVSAAWACARSLRCKFPAARCLIFIGTEGIVIRFAASKRPSAIATCVSSRRKAKIEICESDQRIANFNSATSA